MSIYNQSLQMIYNFERIKLIFYTQGRVKKYCILKNKIFISVYNVNLLHIFLFCFLLINIVIALIIISLDQMLAKN